MSLVKLGSDQWDFVDADGVWTTLPPAEDPAPQVNFPRRWRVFGPIRSRVAIIPPQSVAKDAAVAAIEQLRAIPDELVVGDERYRGTDAEMKGDLLDFGSQSEVFSTTYFDAMQDAAARAGRQVYAMAEIEVNEEIDLPIGAGADYWMQWWIDGKPVYDTLSGGNLVHPPTRTQHAFRCRLTKGKHILAVRVISGQGSWTLHAGVLSPREEALARMSVGDRWQFLPDLDEIRPPHRKGLSGASVLDWGHTMAINTSRCLADETVECEFQMAPEANFGIVFGAQDSGHYYTLQIPRWGQLWRARTFWASLCIADGSGYLRHLKLMLIPHVVCHWNAWIHIKIHRRGNQILTWIDGVKGPSVIDDTYGPGRIGLAGFAKYTVRHLKIDGRNVNGPEWKTGDHRGQPWFVPSRQENSTGLQSSTELLRISGDELLMIYQDEKVESAKGAHVEVVRLLSRDNGRSWSPQPPQSLRDLPMCTTWGLRWFTPRPGVIRAFEIGSTLMAGAKRSALPDDAALAWRDSTDKGKTWTDPKPCKLAGDWSQDIFREGTWNHIYGGTRLKDGTLLTLILHGYLPLRTMIPNRGQGTWGAEVAQPYVSRSEDDGQTWNQPVPMDNAALRDGSRPDGPHGGFSEVAFAQLPSGRIVAQARPFAAPFMWRTHSDDGGKTWRLVTYEPFSGAGGPQLLCTQSGYLVSVKRGPALCMHISADGGANWDEGTIIDYPASFNGQILEVEPDVVLVAYPESMGEFRPSNVRAQLIHITPDGPVPVSNHD